MFTLKAIEEAHSRVKTGADFPEFIKELKALGIIMFDTMVTDSVTVYFGLNNFVLQSAPKYESLKISSHLDKSIFTKQLKLHQQGATDYFTFCEDCAQNGILKWRMNLIDHTCTYFDVDENVVLVEHIGQ